MKDCWRVLQLDRELLLFPLFSLLSCAVIFAVIASPMWFSGKIGATFDWLSDRPDSSMDPVVVAATFALYFIVYFVIIFFNSALIACAKIRFGGGDPTVSDGLRAARQRLPQILAWALVTSIVGFLLNFLSNNKNGRSNIVFGLLGAGWAIAAYFVVPVLVTENVGPYQAVKRSVAIIKKSWGEALVAEVGFSALGFVIVLPAMLTFMIAISVFDFLPVLSILLIAVIVLWVFTCALVLSTLGSILKAALYLYATEGKIPSQFDASFVENAFHKAEG